MKYHATRNCRYFPDNWQADRQPCWQARTKVKDRMLPIRGTETRECPVSRITPQIRRLVDIVSHDHQLHEATGATMFGPVLGRWPAWFADAVSVIQSEITRELNTMRQHGGD